MGEAGTGETEVLIKGYRDHIERMKRISSHSVGDEKKNTRGKGQVIVDIKTNDQVKMDS